MNLPNVKENPIMVALVTVIVICGIAVGSFIAGYMVCRGQSAENNLEILVDDERADKENKRLTNDGLLRVYNNAEVLNSYEEDECAKCFGSVPIPDAWDGIMQSNGDNEIIESD